MKHSVFGGFLGMIVAGGVALVACGDGNDTDVDAAGGAPFTRSSEGESCQRTDDCEQGLACFNLTCVNDPTPAAGSGGSAGNAGNGGSGGSTNPGRLSGDGESCSKTSDCEAGLKCFNLRCLVQPTGEGGDANVPIPPVLGARGETCVLTSDCQAGLVCMPAGGMVGAVGVCTPKESGVEASGKTCFAECGKDADCCELPIEEHGVLGVKSCTELASVLDGVDCDASEDATELRRCFAQSAYCDCDAENPWNCEDGSCVYSADCAASGVVPGGCPERTRSGTLLVSACDVDGSEKCRAPAGGCEEDDDCTNEVVSDDPGDVCAEGECVCHESACLRHCDHDLDCAAGKLCDDEADVCVPSGNCMGDDTCKRLTGDYRATCTDTGFCTVACEADIDCNALTGGALVNVCTDGSCVPIGCQADEECELASDPAGSRRRMFCAEPLAGSVSASSAITD